MDEHCISSSVKSLPASVRHIVFLTKSQAWSCYDNICQQKSKRQDKNQMRLKSYILNNSSAVKGFLRYFLNAKNQNESVVGLKIISATSDPFG